MQFKHQTRHMSPQDAQQYIQDLASGKVVIAPEPNTLEHTIFISYGEAQAILGQMNAALDDTEKQLKRMDEQRDQIKRDIDAQSGAISAYVSILVAAEDARRAPLSKKPMLVEDPKTVDELPDEPPPEPVDEPEPEPVPSPADAKEAGDADADIR